MGCKYLYLIMEFHKVTSTQLVFQIHVAHILFAQLLTHMAARYEWMAQRSPAYAPPVADLDYVLPLQCVWLKSGNV